MAPVENDNQTKIRCSYSTPPLMDGAFLPGLNGDSCKPKFNERCWPESPVDKKRIMKIAIPVFTDTKLKSCLK